MTTDLADFARAYSDLLRRTTSRTCVNCQQPYHIGPEGAVHVRMGQARIGPLCPPCGVAVLAPRD